MKFLLALICYILLLIVCVPLLIFALWGMAPCLTTKIVLLPFKKEGIVKKIYNRYVGMEKDADETKVKKFNLNQIIEEVAPNNTYIWFYNCESFAHYVYPAFKKKMEAIFNSIKEDEDCYIELYEDREFPKNFTNYKHFIYERPMELMDKEFSWRIDYPIDYIGVTIEDFALYDSLRIRDLFKPPVKYNKDEVIKAILAGDKKAPCLKNLHLDQKNSLFYSSYSYKNVITCINETAYSLYLDCRKNSKKNHIKPKNIYFTKKGITHNRHFSVYGGLVSGGKYIQCRKTDISYAPKNDLDFAGDERSIHKSYLEYRGIKEIYYKKFRKELSGDCKNCYSTVLYPRNTEIPYQQWYRCARFYRGAGRIIKPDDKIPDAIYLDLEDISNKKFLNLRNISKTTTLRFT